MLSETIKPNVQRPRGNCNAIRLVSFLVLTLTVLTAVACFKESGSERATTVETNRSANALQQSTSSAPAAEAEDRGDFKLIYHPSKDTSARTARRKVASNPQNIERIIADLNERIALPFDIVVSIEDCGEPNAFYDVAERRLATCYELIDEYYDLFSRRIKDKSKLDEAVTGAIAAVFFHELGHALVDAWKLPITGKEEDAVDQLSTLVLLNSTERGEELALSSAISFKLYAARDKEFEKIYWDEHSLDEQRYYNIICLIYGSNPKKYAYLVEEETLPEERAEMCVEDYVKINNSWVQLLKPYLKQAPGSKPKLSIRRN